MNKEQRESIEKIIQQLKQLVMEEDKKVTLIADVSELSDRLEEAIDILLGIQQSE